jgi:hypothetical protein
VAEALFRGNALVQVLCLGMVICIRSNCLESEHTT